MIEVSGRDAAKVVNNLSTNDLLKLPVGAGQESFVTDVRGWVVSHAAVVKQQDSVWLLGSHESSTKICHHIERYIIREEASVFDRSATHGLLAIGDGPALSPAESALLHDSNPVYSAIQFDTAGKFLMSCPLPILGPASIIVCCLQKKLREAEQAFIAAGSQICSEQLFHWLRISSFWPLHPQDIGEKTIPQELDRDAQAISFTKGCYLGQETIARLDARGQLQKKLCLLEINSSDPQQGFQVGDQLMVGDKEVGQLCSLANYPASGLWRALALLRRGNFTPGTELQCNGQIARVLPLAGC